MLFFPKKQKRSIVKQVTAWYSLFILLILIAVLGAAFWLFWNISETNSQRYLEESATKMRQYVSLSNQSDQESWVEEDDDDDDFETFDDGIYYSVYDSSNQAVTSSFPAGFDQTLTRQDNQVQEVTVNGRTYQYLDLSLSQNQGWLRAVRVKEVLNHDTMEVLIFMGIALPLVMIVVTSGGYWILKRAFRPVQAMTETAKTITENGDYSKRVTTQDRGNELTNLAQVLNTMLASIQETFQREKQFSNDISHELRTPITVILSESEFGEQYADNLDDAKESFEVIHRQSLMMKKMVEQLLELARTEHGGNLILEEVNLSLLVQQEVADQERVLSEKGIQLVLGISPDLHISGQDLLLKRLFDNLMTNAIKFTRDQIRVSLRQEGLQVTLSVANNGPRIPQDQIDKIWQRFYQEDTARNKSKDTGVGLGLSLVKQIADLHGAEVNLQSSEQETVFEVRFPLAIS